MSLRQGHVFVNGVEITDGVACTINFVPESTSIKQLGDYGTSQKYLGHDITGTITRWRATDQVIAMIMQYLDTGVTPEFDLTGVMDDGGSDYYQNYGAITVTALGCVFTEALPLIALDATGDIVKDELPFHAVTISRK
jgi:hypothetical protein